MRNSFTISPPTNLKLFLNSLVHSSSVFGWLMSSQFLNDLYLYYNKNITTKKETCLIELESYNHIILL